MDTAPRIRDMTLADVDAVRELERAAFPDMPLAYQWTRAQLEGHVRRFPRGQWVVVAGEEERVVASCTNMLTRRENALRPHTWMGITGNGALTTHRADGDVLYGTEVMVHPDARRQGLGSRLFKQRFAFVREHGLDAFVTGGRIPGYVEKAGEMMPQDYVDAVVRGDFTDPVLTPDVKWGLAPVTVLCGYLVDPSSLHHAVLMVWENPDRER